MLCAALLAARYLPSLSALQHTHTHTTEHFHSLAFIHSVTGSQQTARENIERGRDVREENATSHIKSTDLVSQPHGVPPSQHPLLDATSLHHTHTHPNPQLPEGSTVSGPL